MPEPGVANARTDLTHIKRILVAGLSFACAIVSGISGLSSWWTFSVSGSSGSGTIFFLPGNSYSESVPGASASLTYASESLGQVGALYEGLLAIIVITLILSSLAGFLALFASFSKNPKSAARRSTVRSLLVVALVVALVGVVLVPTLQPTLFHLGNPSSICSSSGSTDTPCNSFWGSESAGGESASWGSDAGWYLMISSVILGVAAIIIWRSTANDPWPSQVPQSVVGNSTPIASSPQATPANTTLDRVARLKVLLDTGAITQAEFDQVKARLIAPPDSTGQSQTEDAKMSPEFELLKLKELHESGTLSDSEYDDLRKRALQRI